MNPKMIRLLYQHDASSSGTGILFWTTQTDSAFPKDVEKDGSWKKMWHINNEPTTILPWVVYLSSLEILRRSFGHGGAVWHCVAWKLNEEIRLCEGGHAGIVGWDT